MFKKPSVEELYAEVIGAIFVLCSKTPDKPCNCWEILDSIKETYLDV